MNTAEPFDGANGTNGSLYDVLATYAATITNTGNVAGSEIAQLYVSIPEAGEPDRMESETGQLVNVACTGLIASCEGLIK